MHIIHASFADFIQTERCFDEDLRIEPGVYHAYLTTQCFDQMKALKMDICDVQNPSVFHKHYNMPAGTGQNISSMPFFQTIYSRCCGSFVLTVVYSGSRSLALQDPWSLPFPL
jgi:hypothetical protein